jgi:hypothetical protein
VSIPVELADLPAQVARFGSRALLVTNAIDGPPHVASVVVTLEARELSMRAGRSTRANVTANPAVTIVWTVGSEPDHCLVVDGTALDASADTLIVRPTSAVLHRLVTPEGE